MKVSLTGNLEERIREMGKKNEKEMKRSWDNFSYRKEHRPECDQVV